MENNFLVDSDLLSETALKRKHQLENDPSSRIDHMKYLPGMDVIESDVCSKVMAQIQSYDYNVVDVSLGLIDISVDNK